MFEVTGCELFDFRERKAVLCPRLFCSFLRILMSQQFYSMRLFCLQRLLPPLLFDVSLNVQISQTRKTFSTPLSARSA